MVPQMHMEKFALCQANLLAVLSRVETLGRKLIVWIYILVVEPDL